MSRIRSILCVVGLGVLLSPGAVRAQAAMPSPDQSDLAALVVLWDAAEHGHHARLATHAVEARAGEAGARVAASVFLAEGAAVATQGLIAFLLDGRSHARQGGEVRFAWHFAGLDTVVAFPARAMRGRTDVAYATELSEADLRFLTTARSLEVSLPDGTVLVLGEDLRRRLGLLARLSSLSGAQRDELAALTSAIDRSIEQSRRN